MSQRQGWPVVAASALGIAISPGTIVFYTLGVLMGPIAEATGWDRSSIAFAASVFTFVLIFTIPAVGVLIDRFGVRRVLIPSQVLFGATLVAISLCRTIGHLYVAFAALATFGAGANSVSYMRAVCSWFDRHRGFAIGIAQSGMGLGLMLMPLATNALLKHGGWQFAYAALGLLVLLVAVPAVTLFVRENPQGSEHQARHEPLSPESVPVRLAVRQYSFWALMFGFFTLAGAINSAALHLVPMVEASGTTREVALAAASAFGAAMLVGRLATGVLVDRFFAPAVAAAILFCLERCDRLAGDWRIRLAGHRRGIRRRHQRRVRRRLTRLHGVALLWLALLCNFKRVHLLRLSSGHLHLPVARWCGR